MSRRPHVLVAEDDEHTRNIVQDVCRSAGYSVAVATDGEEVLSTLTFQPADLLLLDVMMPRMDGFTVLQTIRARAAWQDLAVIILSGLDDLDGKIRGMELGADDYLTKPFRLIELETRIRSVFTLRQYRQRLLAAQESSNQPKVDDSAASPGSYAQLKIAMDGELARCQRFNRPAAVLLVGIEDYAGVRFQLGREKCEQFVLRLAGAIRASLREMDHLFRLQPDQFILLLPETDAPGSETTGARLTELARKVDAEGRNGKVRARLRIGRAVFPAANIHGTEELLREVYRSFQVAR